VKSRPDKKQGRKFNEMYVIPLIAKSAMNGAQFHSPWVGFADGRLLQNKRLIGELRVCQSYLDIHPT
jgi:hypothetical protein